MVAVRNPGSKALASDLDPQSNNLSILTQKIVSKLSEI
jgi:hypothetical protein